jgi:dihydroflavonol-4-reductase
MADRGWVLVTGGSGYIAGFCILKLLEDGWRVRTTVRNAARAPEVRAGLAKRVEASLAKRIEINDRLQVVAADLNADSGWREAACGCEYVLHVASPLPSSNPKSDDDLVRPARDGALRVLAAARDEGVRRVVMTASTAAVAYGRGGRDIPFTEADWSDETNRADTSAYERSKIIAERAAWEWLKREGGSLELVTIAPARCWVRSRAPISRPPSISSRNCSTARCRVCRGLVGRWWTCATSPTCMSAPCWPRRRLGSASSAPGHSTG